MIQGFLDPALALLAWALLSGLLAHFVTKE